MPSHIKLNYFDFDGGRGLPARVALSIGGIAFEDDRIAFPTPAARKLQMPFGSPPVLEVDGMMQMADAHCRKRRACVGVARGSPPGLTASRRKTCTVPLPTGGRA